MTEALFNLPEDPAEFDVEAWLQDAKLPEESVTVYKRADVIAELSDLKRRIELEARVVDVEKTSAEEALSPLEQEYQALLQTFSNSSLTVYIRAITRERLREMRDAHEEASKDMLPIKSNELFGYELLAESIVAMKSAGKERRSVKLTPQKVEVLEKAIGIPQMQLILDARQEAQNGLPAVDADFLLRRSGGETGQA